MPRVGDAVARRIASIAPPASPAPAPAATDDDRGDDDAPSVGVEPPERAPHAPVPRGATRSASRTGPPAVRLGLDVPEARVSRLTAAQLRGLRATTVLDDQGGASGASLVGVARLGVGLADGDVVTSIDGRPTRTADEATAAAMGAYASGERAAHAVVLRGGRAIAVTVHIPARDIGSTRAGRGDM